MKLNIYIFFDEFTYSSARLIAKPASHGLDISGILQLSEKTVVLDAEHLYIGTPEDVSLHLYSLTALHFAIIGEFDDALLKNLGHSAIILPDEHDLASVYNRFQSIWEKYDRWDNEMLEALCAKRPLQVIFEIGASALVNPIALFDKNYELIAAAGNIPVNVNGSVWASVLKDNYSPTITFSPMLRRNLLDRLLTDGWPFIYHSEVFGEDHLICRLLVAGEFSGFLASAVLAPCSEGQISLCARLSKIMEWVLKNMFERAGTTVDMPYYIGRMLEGYDIDQNIIEFHLQRRGWKINDTYRVLRIEDKEKTALADSECASYKNPLKALLPASILFPYESGIVVILHLFNSHVEWSGLAATLERNGLKVGISMEFSYFIYLKYAYIQCKHALSQKDDALSFFEQSYAK